MPGEPAWDAAAYRDVSTVQRDWGRALLARRAWRGDERVLDAGCGTGELAAELLLAHPHLRLIAVDNDAGMAAACSALLAPFAARAQVLQADVAALPELGPVDVVFSNAVLHWVADHDAVFPGFRRVLAPGGTLLAEWGGAGNLERARAVARAIFQEEPYREHRARVVSPWHYPGAEATAKRLESAGFTGVSAVARAAPVAFPDDDAWTRFLTAVALRVHLAALPVDLRAGFLADYRERARAAGLERRLDYVRLTAVADTPRAAPG